MKRTLLISVAAIALAAGGAQLAGAQQTHPNGPAAGPAANGPTTAPSPNSAPAEIQATPDHKGPAANKGAKENSGPQNQRNTQATPSNQKGPQTSETPQERGTPKNAQQRNDHPTTTGTNERGPNGPANDRTATDRDRTKAPNTNQSTNERDRSMTTRNVSLTTEQRTTIREKVLTRNAPRVEGRVNFDIRVGVVVPRTVRIVPVPVELVEIEPEWRGYMYFVNGDEIIVVEPGTLRIVAVLDV